MRLNQKQFGFKSLKKFFRGVNTSIFKMNFFYSLGRNYCYLHYLFIIEESVNNKEENSLKFVLKIADL